MSESFLAIFPWDVERWFQSDSYLGLSLAEQGAYRNLCDRAWQRQPFCGLPDDDEILWKASGARSREEWLAVRERVLGAGGWTLGPAGWTHPTVLEMYQESSERHGRAVRAGRIAGKVSARVRREMSKHKGHRTIVERSSTKHRQQTAEGDSTIVNPPSPSPSPSPSTDNEQRTTECGAIAPPGSPAAAKPAKPARETWLTPYGEDWQARWGAESKPPWGEMARHLRPVHEQHGLDETRLRWRRFLAGTERSEWARPIRFVEGFGQWGAQARAPTGRPDTVGYRTIAEVEKFIAAAEARKEGG